MALLKVSHTRQHIIGCMHSGLGLSGQPVSKWRSICTIYSYIAHSPLCPFCNLSRPRRSTKQSARVALLRSIYRTHTITLFSIHLDQTLGKSKKDNKEQKEKKISAQLIRIQNADKIPAAQVHTSTKIASNRRVLFAVSLFLYTL